jgi:cell fate regulator YaaT (PSP1 superfamily)
MSDNISTDEQIDKEAEVVANTQVKEDSDNQSKKKSNKKNNFEITEDNCTFTADEILRFVRIRFPGNAKSFPFLIGQRKLSYGQKIVAMSDRGMAVGYVNSFPFELNFKTSMLPIKTISKIANDYDLEKERETYIKQKEAETICQDFIEKHKLDMNMTHVEFTQFGKKVVFYFNSPARVDFRGLVRDLVTTLKLRIELRQISVRDRAAAIGGIGPCGRQLCCSSFLTKYGNVNIKMAKNQNLTLTYSMLNGVCGHLKCCLTYEDDVYTDKRKALPREDTIVKTKTGEVGKVQRLHLLNEQFDMLTNKGVVKRFTVDEFSETLADYKFPRKFDHISNETQTVVGLDNFLHKRSEEFKDELATLSEKQPEYAHAVFDKLFEGESFLDKTTPTPEKTAQVTTIHTDEEISEEPVKSKLYREPSEEKEIVENKPANTQKNISEPNIETDQEVIKASSDAKDNSSDDKKNKKPYKGKNNNWRNKKKDNSDKKEK